MKHALIFGFGTTIVDTVSRIFTPMGGSAVLEVSADQLRNGNAPYNDELQYLALLQELVDKADEAAIRDDRTGVGTYSVFGRQIRFDLSGGKIPVLTTKRVFWKGVTAELEWMIDGDTNARTLQDKGVHIWDEWAGEDGELGPVYGKQWRAFRGKEGHIDQLADVVKAIKENPNSRRHIVTAWDPALLPDMALPPCHMLFQFYVEDGKLSCQLYQRSADIFLGVPFNIASYALLTHLVAHECGLEAGEFVHTFGDLHLYSNHVEAARLQLTRSPRAAPLIAIGDDTDLLAAKLDVELVDYNPHDAIKAEVAV